MALLLPHKTSCLVLDTTILEPTLNLSLILLSAFNLNEILSNELDSTIPSCLKCPKDTQHI